MGTSIDLNGKKFGRLAVVGYSKERKYNRPTWECLCSCGNVVSICGKALTRRKGATNSCGCLAREVASRLCSERFYKHGHRSKNFNKDGFRGSSTYQVWADIKTRCQNKKHSSYKDYGGRGILVCIRWKSSFEAFLEDMGERPSSEHSIDRIDNNGSYDPKNCKWSTTAQQSINKRSSVNIVINGEIKNLSEWCRFYEISYGVVYTRLKRGWSIERAFSR